MVSNILISDSISVSHGTNCFVRSAVLVLIFTNGSKKGSPYFTEDAENTEFFQKRQNFFRKGRIFSENAENVCFFLTENGEFSNQLREMHNFLLREAHILKLN